VRKSGDGEEGGSGRSGGASLGKVVLAVAFDERLEGLLESALALCRRARASLRLVHVSDPWTKSFLATAVESGPPDLVRTLKDEAVRVGRRRLGQLAATLPGDVDVETEVLGGDLVKTLAADAEANDASLIVVGAHTSGVGTALGVSTAVSLIAEARVPVMVLGDGVRFAPRGESLRVVVGDDFTELGASALRVGFALARLAPGGQLFHVHVEGYAELDELGARRSRRADGDGRPAALAAGVTPEQIEFVHRQAEERMLDRCGDGPERLVALGGEYHLEIVSGQVADELERSAVAARADVCVFGQHRVFHRQDKRVGRVPFKSMLAQSRPVIVVPPV
jgi:nucleotide-binding universal stress UspA family protein